MSAIARSTVTPGAVADRLAETRERITAAGGDPNSIRVVAVTKGFGPEAVGAGLAAGIEDIGENYAAELIAKHGVIGQTCRWHFLGHVQRNKVKSLASLVDLWQAVDRVAAGREIASRVGGAHVLVQVNVSGEPQRNGCSFEEAPALVEELTGLGLRVEGLMAVAPAGEPEAARPGFRRVVELADRLALAERSMGMSDDLEVAVQEGTTMVRLGRALFGQRPLRQAPRR